MLYDFKPIVYLYWQKPKISRNSTQTPSYTHNLSIKNWNTVPE